MQVPAVYPTMSPSIINLSTYEVESQAFRPPDAGFRGGAAISVRKQRGTPASPGPPKGSGGDI